MNRDEFITAVTLRAARIAAGPSATRGNGKGTVEVGRRFLGRLDLKRFAVSTDELFQKELNRATSQLANRFRNPNWGLARKLLNIFLRDVLYTSYLCDEFHFARIEHFLEIPLDSITAKEFRRRAPLDIEPLGHWKGVKHLTRELNGTYQEVAKQLAKLDGIARVHLDTYWWGERASDRSKPGKSFVSSRGRSKDSVR